LRGWREEDCEEEEEESGGKVGNKRSRHK